MGGGDLSFSMLIRLMDQWSAPADKIRQSMRNMSQGARDMRREMGRKITTGFSATEIEAAMSRSERRVSDARGRLMGAAAMAVTLGAPVVAAGNFEERLIDFANLAEIGSDRAAELDRQLDQLRLSTGQSKLQLLDGLEAYVGKGMGLDEAIAGMEATGRAAKATKSAMNELANSGFAVMDNLDVSPDELRKAFDIMAKSGKEGSFELAAMARKFPEITAGAKSLKMEGVDAVASLSAALQIAMKSAGSEDQAATNMTNFLGKITATDTVKKFKEAGVDIEKEMQIALSRGADPMLHMLQVIEKMTGGNAFKMGELFADKQVLDFLRAMIPNLEEYQRIKAEALGADGVIDADYERVMKGFNEGFRQLKNSVTSLLGASGALLPVITDIMNEVRFGVDAVAAWTSANPELTATIVKGTAGLLAFGIASRVVSFGYALMFDGALRTAAMFLKFDKSGKNISVMARSARLAGRSFRGLYRGGRGLARMMRTPLKWAIVPLRWTAGMIPALPWRRLAGMLSWRTLIKAVLWSSRFISPIGWALLAGTLLWKKLIVPLGWDDFIYEIDWKKFLSFEWVNELPKWKWLAIIGGPITWGTYLLFKWTDVLPTWDWGAIIPDFNLGQIFKAGGLSDQERADRDLSGRNRLRIRTPQDSLENALAEGRSRPTSAPLGGPFAYGTSQPNVQVESRFEGNTKLDVAVKVDMPISIRREQAVNNAQIAKDAGRRAGSETERAVRRSLDDAANVE
ncbi:phage tail tape measure protein [Cognatishimia sp. MH4019]|uniref:phage tail tape measure protein n=1 Tax=Cognatishimia sp. MH4019 TaxID=2854030 RepID=UPI001CD46BB8|nr:phage tail tape measure protein [Cognatishimia sp. MH4019]